MNKEKNNPHRLMCVSDHTERKVYAEQQETTTVGHNFFYDVTVLATRRFCQWIIVLLDGMKVSHVEHDIQDIFFLWLPDVRCISLLILCEKCFVLYYVCWNMASCSTYCRCQFPGRFTGTYFCWLPHVFGVWWASKLTGLLLKLDRFSMSRFTSWSNIHHQHSNMYFFFIKQISLSGMKCISAFTATRRKPGNANSSLTAWRLCNWT